MLIPPSCLRSYSNRLERILTSLFKPTSTSLKLAAFPTVLPFIYQTLLPIVSRWRHSTNTPYTREITAFLSSPAILLLPAGLRVYLALYAVTSAMTTFLKSASPKDVARKAEEERADEKEWRDYLPPVCPLQAPDSDCPLFSTENILRRRSGSEMLIY